MAIRFRKYFSEQEELEIYGLYMFQKQNFITFIIDEQQKAFYFAKRLLIIILEITERLFTFSWIKFDNFDQVLNNFYASYFAGALLIPRKQLVNELNLFLANRSSLRK
jgi:hypothetical protein